jgi:cytochrome c553
MKNFAATLALLAVFTDVASAGCPIVRHKAVVVDTAIVTPVVVATFVPVQVASYSASYQPTPTTDPAVVELLRQMGSRVAALEAGAASKPGPPPGPPPSPMRKADVADPGLDKFAAACASCHDSAVAKVKGGGIVFFANGVETDYSCDLALRAVGAIADGSMPRGKKLADEDVAEVVIHLSKRAKR